MRRRKKKRNPDGRDVVGFLVGAALPIAAGMTLVPLPFAAVGTTVLAGVGAAISGADKPGFLRGAAFGGLATFLGTMGLAVVAAMQDRPAPQVTA